MFATGKMITPSIPAEELVARRIKRQADPHFRATMEAEHVIEFIEGKKRCFAYGFDRKANKMRDYSEKEYRELQAAGKIVLDL